MQSAQPSARRLRPTRRAKPPWPFGCCRRAPPPLPRWRACCPLPPPSFSWPLMPRRGRGCSLYTGRHCSWHAASIHNASAAREPCAALPSFLSICYCMLLHVTVHLPLLISATLDWFLARWLPQLLPICTSQVTPPGLSSKQPDSPGGVAPGACVLLSHSRLLTWVCCNAAGSACQFAAATAMLIQLHDSGGH